jgi:hypothetical protein
MKKYKSLVRIDNIINGKARCVIPDWNLYETVGVPIGQFPDPEELIERLERYGIARYFARVNLDAPAARFLEFSDWEELNEIGPTLEDNRPPGYAIGDQMIPTKEVMPSSQVCKTR